MLCGIWVCVLEVKEYMIVICYKYDINWWKKRKWKIGNGEVVVGGGRICEFCGGMYVFLWKE